MAKMDPARENLEQLVSAVRECRDGDLDLVKVMSFAELMVESVQTYFDSLDKTIYAEIRGIGDYIAKAKGEIGNLQAHDLKDNHIPEAGRELDQIVLSTEEATNSIMEAAEQIMSIEADDLETYQAKVNDSVMAIFEACSFQDITGQRINKVVQTMQYIETRISRFSEALGIDDSELKLTEKEQKQEDRKHDLLLYGPGGEGEAIDQDNVDALMNGGNPAKTAAPDEQTSDKATPKPEKVTKAQEKPKAKSQPKEAPKPAPEKVTDDADNGEVASQDDIDALFG